MSLSEFRRRILPKTQQRREPKPKKAYRPPEGFSSHVQNKIVMPRSGGWCELDWCDRAVWFHHRRPRGTGGTSLEWVDDAANCLHLSDRCHRWVEGIIPGSNRNRSGVLGWLVSQHSGVLAENTPVWYRSRWVFLHNNGDVEPIDDATLLTVPTPEEFYLP